ncbi:MAG TPA: NAD(P)H-dependent oxidoreductase [Alphaproteobacteria bacterium]|nr:NAD(P)H-dependent oxidoreductase [Alphaproteobacteria bacterium]
MTALLLQCSPRGPGSASRAAAEGIVERLALRQPGLKVLRRDLAAAPPPLVDAGFAAALGVPPERQTPAQRAALASSEAMILELETTSALVIGTPMHNFTVPAVLKAWIDQVLRIGRSFRSTPEGKVGLLADRPAYVAVASGGVIVGERARQPDFLTPYLTAALATLGIHDVRFLHLEPVRHGEDGAVRRDAQLAAWLDLHLPRDALSAQASSSTVSPRCQGAGTSLRS